MSFKTKGRQSLPVSHPSTMEVSPVARSGPMPSAGCSLTTSSQVPLFASGSTPCPLIHAFAIGGLTFLREFFRWMGVFPKGLQTFYTTPGTRTLLRHMGDISQSGPFLVTTTS